MYAATDGTKVCPYCAETVKLAAVVCKHCGRSLDAKAPARREGWSLEPAAPKRRWWPWVLGVPVGLFAAFMLLGAFVSRSPDAQALGQERRAIALCWENQAKKSADPEQARFIAGACELLEQRFQQAHGLRP